MSFLWNQTTKEGEGESVLTEKLIDTTLNLMKEQKVINVDGNKFILNPSFVAVMNSSFQKYDYTNGLINAVKSYCPELSTTHLAIIMSGVMRVFEMHKSPIFHEIQAQLDKDFPDDIISRKSLDGVED